jgi:hypothetical protein
MFFNLHKTLTRFGTRPEGTICPYAVCASTSAPRIQRSFMNKFFQEQRMKREHKTYTYSYISENLILLLFTTRIDALRYENNKRQL